MTDLIDDIVQAFKNLGGTATLKEIYGEVERIRIAPLSKTWPAKVRQTIEYHSVDSKVFKGKDIFHKIGVGVWALRDQTGIIKSPPTRHGGIDKRPKDILIPESFETIANYLRTIKEYREFSNPASPAWVDYIQEFFHIIGFSTEMKGSRLILLKDMGGNTPRAIVGYMFPGENVEKILPDLDWDIYLLFAANYYQIEWGILTNGLQLKIINFGAQKDRPPYFWPDLDGTIENEKLDNFFAIYKVFSYMRLCKEDVMPIQRISNPPETQIPVSVENDLDFQTNNSPSPTIEISEGFHTNYSHLLSGENRTTLQAGPIYLDLKNHTVNFQGKFTHLTPTLLNLLSILIEHRGEVVERKWLFSQAWETKYTDNTRTLDVHISWLRQAIEVDPNEPVHLKTVRGVGYRLDV